MNGIDIILLFELRNLELKHTYQTFEEEYSNNRKLLSRACLACLDIILHILVNIRTLKYIHKNT